MYMMGVVTALINNKTAIYILQGYCSNAYSMTRPQGIMLQILFIMLFRISQKIGSLCSLLFFLYSTLL